MKKIIRYIFLLLLLNACFCPDYDIEIQSINLIYNNITTSHQVYSINCYYDSNNNPIKDTSHIAEISANNNSLNIYNLYGDSIIVFIPTLNHADTITNFISERGGKCGNKLVFFGYNFNGEPQGLEPVYIEL